MQLIQDFCVLSNTTQIVTDATHRGNLLDHVYISKGMKYQNLCLLSPIEKFHTPILFTIIPNGVSRNQTSSKRVYQWSKADWNIIRTQLSPKSDKVHVAYTVFTLNNRQRSHLYLA